MSMEKTVMTPNPPSWMSARITTLPNRLQCTAVSTTTSPVTQTEVVAVNSAVSGPVCCPLAVEIGSHSSSVPTRIAERKLSGISRTGDEIR